MDLRLYSRYNVFYPTCNIMCINYIMSFLLNDFNKENKTGAYSF